MEMVIFNPQKGRLDSIDAEVNEAHTPWFSDEVKTGDSLPVPTALSLAGLDMAIKPSSRAGRK
ncbi:MAG: hypothetical protein ABIJ50_11260 [Pseudomonadota bacterium]